MSIRILFVDDEQSILEGLERSLFDMADEWNMHFATSGAEALKVMEAEPADVIVSDMRMPGMDGAALLSEVKKKHPHTVRVVLSGQVDDAVAFRAVDVAHQFLSKPCDPDELKKLIGRALSLRTLLAGEVLKNVLASAKKLPSLPEMYENLIEELNHPDASIKAVANIIGRDVSMSARVLQIVNSSFFGTRNRVTSMDNAVAFLGINTIKTLVLTSHAFEQCNGQLPPGFSVERLSQHSLAVGSCARAILRTEKSDEAVQQDGFTAGMLHDFGKLILAVNFPDKFSKALKKSEQEQISHEAAEDSIFSTTHAHIGAYLIGIWGLPDSIVEGVAFHHRPRECAAEGLNIATVLHVADYFVRTMDKQASSGNQVSLDMEYLRHINMESRLPDWQEKCEKIMEGVDHD